MLLEFPDDPTCNYLDRQYMLGESLLVAPIFSNDNVVTYYLPAGRWTNFFTSETMLGPGWFSEVYDFMSLPVMVRPNSVIAIGCREDRPDYDYGEGVTLQVYQLEDGKHVSTAIPSVRGEIQITFEVMRDGRTILVERHGKSGTWRVLLVGIPSIESVQCGTVESHAQGVLVTPGLDTDTLQIFLS